MEIDQSLTIVLVQLTHIFSMIAKSGVNIANEVVASFASYESSAANICDRRDSARERNYGGLSRGINGKYDS